jgi:hypothetical protein
VGALRNELGELHNKVNVLTRAVGTTSPNTLVEMGRVRVPEPRAYGGARELLVRHGAVLPDFRMVRTDSEEAKFKMATMYLSAQGTPNYVWWRTKHADIQASRCVIDSWEDLKREIKTQFFPENVEYIARRNLRELSHTSTVVST